MKQKSTFRSLLFEKKLSAMQRIQEEREAQLVEVLDMIYLLHIVTTFHTPFHLLYAKPGHTPSRILFMYFMI